MVRHSKTFKRFSKDEIEQSLIEPFEKQAKRYPRKIAFKNEEVV
jgi:hypothetical protein